jgi:hypothetical protein
MATPVAVPLVSSSNFDCSQVRVPSANAVETIWELKLVRRKPEKRKRKNLRALCNCVPRSVVMENIQGYHGCGLMAALDALRHPKARSGFSVVS